MEDIPNADSLETKEEKEEIEGVITPIYQTKSALSGAVKSLKGLRDNLFNNENNDEEYDETEAEEFFNNPYETYDDFVSITPLTEEEIKAELAEEEAKVMNKYPIRNGSGKSQGNLGFKESLKPTNQNHPYQIWN